MERNHKIKEYLRQNPSDDYKIYQHVKQRNNLFNERLGFNREIEKIKVRTLFNIDELENYKEDVSKNTSNQLSRLKQKFNPRSHQFSPDILSRTNNKKMSYNIEENPKQRSKTIDRFYRSENNT